AVDVAAAFETAPAPDAQALGTESVPVGEPGDQPVAAAAEGTEAPPRHAISTDLPTHEVTGSSTNPKRGWWRRVIDR
ncbi:MAG TPA: hypothetical protein VE397_15895, partial [Stellaceae bacterium]|nr:hypothetical protein [Stellaceae bacterium]